MYLRIEYIVKCASYQHRYDSVVGKAIGRDERERDDSEGIERAQVRIPLKINFHMLHANHGSRLLGLGLLFAFLTYVGTNNRLFVPMVGTNNRLFVPT